MNSYQRRERERITYMMIISRISQDIQHLLPTLELSAAQDIRMMASHQHQRQHIVHLGQSCTHSLSRGIGRRDNRQHRRCIKGGSILFSYLGSLRCFLLLPSAGLGGFRGVGADILKYQLKLSMLGTKEQLPIYASPTSPSLG